MREHRRGPQVGPRSGGGEGWTGKHPSAGWAVAGPGTAQAQEPKEGRTQEHPSPGTPGAGLCRKVRARLQDQRPGHRPRLLSYPQKELGVALSDERKCVPRHGLWVVSCTCASFLPVARSERTHLSVCVNRATGSFLVSGYLREGPASLAQAPSCLEYKGGKKEPDTVFIIFKIIFKI